MPVNIVPPGRIEKTTGCRFPGANTLCPIVNVLLSAPIVTLSFCRPCWISQSMYAKAFAILVEPPAWYASTAPINPVVQPDGPPVVRPIPPGLLYSESAPVQLVPL